MGLKTYIFEEITQNVPKLVTYTKPEILEVRKSRIIQKTALATGTTYFKPLKIKDEVKI